MEEIPHHGQKVKTEWSRRASPRIRFPNPTLLSLSHTIQAHQQTNKAAQPKKKKQEKAPWAGLPCKRTKPNRAILLTVCLRYVHHTSHITHQPQNQKKSPPTLQPFPNEIYMYAKGTLCATKQIQKPIDSYTVFPPPLPIFIGVSSPSKISQGPDFSIPPESSVLSFFFFFFFFFFPLPRFGGGCQSLSLERKKLCSFFFVRSFVFFPPPPPPPPKNQFRRREISIGERETERGGGGVE